MIQSYSKATKYGNFINHKPIHELLSSDLDRATKSIRHTSQYSNYNMDVNFGTSIHDRKSSLRGNSRPASAISHFATARRKTSIGLREESISRYMNSKAAKHNFYENLDETQKQVKAVVDNYFKDAKQSLP